MEDFEKYATDRLRNHPSPLDTDRLWAGIEADLRPKKRRPLAFWWWLTSLGLGAALAGLFFAWPDGGEAKSPADKPSAENPVATVPAPPVAPASHAATPPVPHPAPAAHAPTRQNLPATAENSRPAARPIGSKTSRTTAVNPLIFNEKANQTPSVAQPETAAQPPVSAEKTAAPRASFWADFAQLPMPGGGPVASENERGIQPAQIAPPEDKCYRFNGGLRLRPYLLAYGGAHLPMRKLTTGDPEFEAAAEARRQTETVLEAISVGGAVGLHLTKNVFVEAGAEWQRVTERFDWSRTTRDTLGKFVTTGFLVNAPGDTTFYMDSVAIVRTTTTRKQTFNRYTFVHLPLAVGYSWRPRARLGAYAKAGLALNLAFQQRGEVLDLQGEPQRFDSRDTTAGHPFRSKIGLAPFAAVGLRYGLGPRLDLLGEARYQQHLTDVTDPAYALRQRYALFGLNVGLRWRF
ncbi:MAG: hypothetical protein ACK4Q5_02725 [Saprospiraceae bacterium]